MGLFYIRVNVKALVTGVYVKAIVCARVGPIFTGSYHKVFPKLVAYVTVTVTVGAYFPHRVMLRIFSAEQQPLHDCQYACMYVSVTILKVCMQEQYAVYFT